MKEENQIKNWRPNIYLFLFSQFFSGITSMIVQYSIIWYLTKQTESASILSIATLLGMLPAVILSPFIGPFVDRTNKKALLVIPDVIAAIFAIILSVVGFLSHDFPIWLIFISLLIRSIAQTFQMPTIQSIFPTMIPSEQLTKINGQLGMVQSANFIIAPALGAFLFSIISMPLLILFDVLGAIIAVFFIIFLVKIPEFSHIDEHVHILADAKFGLKQLYSKKGIWNITLMGTFFTLAFMPAVSMFPLMTMSYFKGSVMEAGLIEVVYSIGSLLGGAIIGFFGNWKDRIKPITWSIFIIGISMGWSAFLPPNHVGYVWFAILNVFGGISAPFFNTLLMAIIQQSYPAKNLGKILGIMNSLMSLAGPVGLIFAGPLADNIGVNNLFVIAGIGTLLCGFFVTFNKSIKEYDKNLQEELKQKVL
ncbi:MFS transporter [Companilactobacillus sp. HBUAS56257]|uniref:MFS transporter n=1 Tax=Companilactobacillus sp. HBUAS56257 TaxID=3109360 RepID=UPI002FEE6978